MRKKITFVLVVLLYSISNDGYGFWFKVPDKSEAIITMGKSTESVLNPNQIKLLVWNMYKGKNYSWGSDFNYLRDRHDILVLQEALLNEKMGGVLKNDDEFQYQMATSFIYKKKKQETGVVTGAKVEAFKTYFKKTKNVEWIGLTPKVMLFTEYKFDGIEDKLLVINIHAINTVPTRILAKQIRQAGKKIKKHKGPIIFAGDFNTWNKKKTRFMKQYLKSLGMKEVEFPNGEERMAFKLTGKVLDYVWVKGLNYDSSIVMDEIDGADHKPMSVTLRVE